MQIEEGKFYRTRDGRKVGPMGKSLYAGSFPWVGDRPDGEQLSFAPYGYWRTDGQTHHNDLIAEWADESPLWSPPIEPARRSGEVWVSICEGGSVAHFSKESAGKFAEADRLACIRVPWTEGQFDE